jgi:hypothetical protein
MPILGDGVAACCCAHILGARIETAGRARIPALIVGDATQRLIADVFGNPHIFDGLPRIERRVVAWGSDAVTLPHRAVVISEAELTARLRPVGGAPLEWTIRSSRPLPPECTEQHFGKRTATASPVEIKGDPQAFWIESLPSGWLFLLPGWLLAVGGEVDAMLAESRLIAGQIGHRGPAGAGWPAHPRIATPLFGNRWLSCGTAAVGFDPICGDGTGYAVREGILAAAVLRAADKGGNPEELGAHYTARVVAGFRRHLELCREYYRIGGAGPWWRSELEALEQGIAWCGPDREFRYRLNQFELERISSP